MFSTKKLLLATALAAATLATAGTTWAKDLTIGLAVANLQADFFNQIKQSVEAEGKGAIIYLSQEGRGIGLINKIRTYKLQEQGRDTVEANIELGFREDERDYGIGANIMRDIGLGKVRLISNNPVKRAGLEGYGISIVETIPLVIEANPFNSFYLHTKATKMGHSLSCYKTPTKGEND